jgi:hypothetical protein
MQEGDDPQVYPLLYFGVFADITYPVRFRNNIKQQCRWLESI